MKKLIGRLLAIVLIAALAVCGIVTYNGYRFYKEVTEAVPVSEKVAEIEEQAHYTTYESLPKRYVEAVIAAEDRRFFRCLLYTSPSPRDMRRSRMPSSA